MKKVPVPKGIDEIIGAIQCTWWYDVKAKQNNAAYERIRWNERGSRLRRTHWTKDAANLPYSQVHFWGWATGMFFTFAKITTATEIRKY